MTESWIFILTGVGVCLIALALFLIERIHDKVSSLHKHSTGVPQGDVGAIEQSIDGIRNHISSNHDELDGELRRIAEAQESMAREAVSERHARFEKDIAEELARVKADAEKAEPPKS